MLYLLLCVSCSVIVSVLLKLAKRSQVILAQAVAFNYVMALGLTIYLLKPKIPTHWAALPWWLFLALGVLLPSIFIVMGKAVDVAGIVKSDAAQRLSLFLPILAAVIIFGEQLTQSRILGIVLAFIALFALLTKQEKQQKSSGLSAAFLLLGVWFGYGVIDILFKQVAKSGSTFSLNLLVIFTLAGLLMFLYLAFLRQKITIKSLLGGLLLGVFNFLNILFYIKAHQAFSDNPTLVFTVVNLGVIALGTLTGVWVFREKLSTFNIAGLVLAFFAIIMLVYGENILMQISTILPVRT